MDGYYNYNISSSSKRTRSDSDFQVHDYNLTTTTTSNNEPNSTSQRRYWVKNRSKAWWELVSGPDYPEQEFKRAFRMSRATFDFICQELEPFIAKKDTTLRSAIPVPHRVAVCVWRLAHGEALRDVSKRFGLGIATCHGLVRQVCTAIKTLLMPKFLQWPDKQRMDAVKREFENLSGISNVGGLIYTTHIPIVAPKEMGSAYYNKKHTERNQKTSYSTTVQGVVDFNGIFTDVCIGWPGSMSDDQVLEKSALYEKATATTTNEGALKGVWVIGNSSFPLLDWLLVPYTHRNLAWAEHAYNARIEEVMKIAREAFTRLKSRWACLQKRTEMKLEDLPVIVGACCVLHNICEMRGEGLSDELRFDVFDDAMVPENNPVRSVDARNERDRIAHTLLHRTHAVQELT